MGTAVVEELTNDQINRERETILKDVHMSEGELESRARHYQLTETESLAWRRFRALTWLLGK